jgi:ankyrin repeat protein
MYNIQHKSLKLLHIFLFVFIGWLFAINHTFGLSSNDLLQSIKSNEISDEQTKKIIQEYIDSGSDINVRSTSNISLLSATLHYKKYNSAKVLLDNSAHANNHNVKINLHPLLYSAREGLYTFVESLLLNKTDPNIISENGVTAIYLSVYNRKLKVFNTLIKYNADIHAKYENETLLHTAATKGSHAFISTLLEKNIDINAKNNVGETALIITSRSAEGDVHENSYNIVLKGKKKIIPMLLEQENIDLNIQDNEGNTALMRAVQRNDINMIKQLIEKGADVNKRIYNNNTALLYAVKNKNTEIINYLFENNIDQYIYISDEIIQKINDFTMFDKNKILTIKFYLQYQNITENTKVLKHLNNQIEKEGNSIIPGVDVKKDKLIEFRNIILNLQKQDNSLQKSQNEIIKNQTKENVEKKVKQAIQEQDKVSNNLNKTHKNSNTVINKGSSFGFREQFIAAHEKNLENVYKPNIEKEQGLQSATKLTHTIAKTITNVISFLAIVVILFFGIELVFTTSDAENKIKKTQEKIFGTSIGLLFLQGGNLVVDIFVRKGEVEFSPDTQVDSYSMLKTIDNLQASVLSPLLDFFFALLPVFLMGMLIYSAVMILISGSENIQKYTNAIIASIAGLIVILLAKTTVALFYGVGKFEPDPTKIAGLTSEIINYILYIVGPMTIGIIIYGGYLAIANMGDEGMVKKAYKIIGFAIIGLVIILSSYVIVNTFLTI